LNDHLLIALKKLFLILINYRIEPLLKMSSIFNSYTTMNYSINIKKEQSLK